MDQRRMQSGRRRLMDLEDAPELDPGDEAALDAIRRQLDEEFAAPEAAREVSELREGRASTAARPESDERARVRASSVQQPLPESEPGTRPAPDSPRRMRAVPERERRRRFAPDAEERPARGLHHRQPPAWARPERFRDERTVQARSRIERELAERFGVQRIPAQWREVEAPTPEEPGSRRGLFVTIGLAAGLTGGAAGALLTVLLLTGGPSDSLQRSWGKVVAAARDSGLVDIAATVTDRGRSADRRDSEPRGTARDSQESPTSPSPSAPRRGPVATSEIAEPGAPGARAAESAASLELRGLVAAGREAYVRRDYAMAERLFSRSVERSAGDGLLRYHHAIALMGLGRFSEARIEFQNALRLGVDPMVADEAQRALAQLSASRRRR